MAGQRRPTAKGAEAEAVRTRWHDIDLATEGLRRSEPNAIERCLQFLEEDPNFHRSGYVKEGIWRRFMNAEVPSRQLRRLEDVGLAYLERRMTREFWYMARTMAERASYAFWEAVRRETLTGDRARKRRATALLAYEQGMAAGEAMREKVWYEAAQERSAQRRSRK
jgi:hypothetical protein